MGKKFGNESNQAKLRDEYVKWLRIQKDYNPKKENAKEIENVINSYKTYFNNSFKCADDIFLKELGIKVSELNWMGSHASKQMMHRSIVAIMSGIINKKKQDEPKYAKAQSGFNNFVLFLDSKGYGIKQSDIVDAIKNGKNNEKILDKRRKNDKGKEISETVAVQEKLMEILKDYPKPIIYSHDDLEDIFKNRLITQDRYYEKMFLPISILNKLTDGRYNDKNDQELPHMKFIFGKGDDDYVSFENIDKVLIYAAEQKVCIKVKGKKGEKILLTETKNIGEYEPLKTMSISDLSIDHDNALMQQLKNKVNSYPELKKMTDEIIKSLGEEPSEYDNYREIKVKSEGGKSISKVLGKKGKSEEIYIGIKNDIDSDKLIVELEKVFIEVGGYTIMHRSYNSSLGGKD